MFRKLFIVLCVIVVLVVAAGTGMVLFSQEESVEEETIDEESIAGEISFIQGEVEVLCKGETDWGKAQQGQVLNVGDKVRTMDYSAVEIEFVSGALSSLEDNSEMGVKSAVFDYDGDRYKTTLDLILGKVLVNVEKIGNEELIFGVETPVAVAVVWGTEFVVDATSADDTSVAVFSGKVRVKKKGMKNFVVVKKNRKLRIKKKTIKLRKPSRMDKKTLKLKKKFVRLKKKAINFRKKKLDLKRKRIKLRRETFIQKEVYKKIELKNIAVSDFVPQAPVSPADATFVTEFFRGDLVKSEVLNVLDRKSMAMILAEQGFQQTGCTDQECAVQMGKILNVQAVVTGNFGKLIDRYVLTINVVDVESGKIIYSDKGSCYSQDEIDNMALKLANRLVKALN